MFFRTTEEKKSAIITTALFVVMMLIMSIAIFPPEAKELEGGGGGGTIALNFGFDEYGMGDYNSPDPVVAQPQTTVNTNNESQLLTSDNQDAIAIKDTPKKEETKPETSPSTRATPVVQTTPQPDRNVTDAIGNLLGGDGNTNQAGNQGSTSGSLNSQGYEGDGNGGSGTGSGGGHGSGQGLGTGSGYGTGSGAGSGSGHGDYNLAGRKSVAMPAPQYKCNEEGRVVVEISVDRTGKVIEAKPGVRGTTNTAKCLVDIAQQAALQARFDSSTTAPNRQVGTITYNFKLRE